MKVSARIGIDSSGWMVCRIASIGPEGARSLAAGLQHVPGLTELGLRRGVPFLPLHKGKTLQITSNRIPLLITQNRISNSRLIATSMELRRCPLEWQPTQHWLHRDPHPHCGAFWAYGHYGSYMDQHDGLRWSIPISLIPGVIDITGGIMSSLHCGVIRHSSVMII
jgi:hypothetical protein